MRRYDDPVEVRRGMVAGPGGTQEGPEQFLWRGRLWKVCDVMAHWVETGAWWRSRGAGAVLGTDTERQDPPWPVLGWVLDPDDGAEGRPGPDSTGEVGYSHRGKLARPLCHRLQRANTQAERPLVPIDGVIGRRTCG